MIEEENTTEHAASDVAEEATELAAEGIIEDAAEVQTLEGAEPEGEIEDVTEPAADEDSEQPILAAEELQGSELEGYESAEVEDTEFIEDERIMSILESVLFSTEKPQSMATIKQAFKGTNVKSKQIKRSLEALMVEYAGAERGITIEEVTGGYQLRTKSDNMDYLRRMVKARPFKLSGPALEVLSIVAYKQPCAKMHVDEVRGVESGHLLRGLMEKGLCAFAGKSELPGKPMLYQTTRKFLEIFGLRNLQELPTLSEIDELLPAGIEPEQAEKKETLDQVAGDLAQEAITTYSSSEDELNKITDKLGEINTSSDFFAEEKRREKERRDKERAQDLRESLEFSEAVEDKDIKWLARYDKEQEDKLKAEEEKLKAEEHVLHAQEEALAEERHELEDMIVDSEEPAPAAELVASEVSDIDSADEENTDEVEVVEVEVDEIENFVESSESESEQQKIQAQPETTDSQVPRVNESILDALEAASKAKLEWDDLEDEVTEPDSAIEDLKGPVEE